MDQMYVLLLSVNVPSIHIIFLFFKFSTSIHLLIPLFSYESPVLTMLIYIASDHNDLYFRYCYLILSSQVSQNISANLTPILSLSSKLHEISRKILHQLSITPYKEQYFLVFFYQLHNLYIP